MYHTSISFITIFILMLLLSCNGEDDNPTISSSIELPVTVTADLQDKITNAGCTFVQNDDERGGTIDEIETALMAECLDNQFTSINEIENNLIGQWTLIGYGNGRSPYPSRPCVHITITEEDLTLDFKNAYRDFVSVHSWEIEAVSSAGYDYFRLNTTPIEHDYGLFINQFSEELMFGNSTLNDGNMYIYKKVE